MFFLFSFAVSCLKGSFANLEYFAFDQKSLIDESLGNKINFKYCFLEKLKVQQIVCMSIFTKVAFLGTFAFCSLPAVSLPSVAMSLRKYKSL